jgi:RIO-like serine/threonine protein kinase
MKDLEDFVLLSRRERHSEVWWDQDLDVIYKTAPKFLIDNEWYFLNQLASSGYVPEPVYKPDIEIITMPYIHPEIVTDAQQFMKHLEYVLEALKEADCRHGDLTKYSVLVQNNKPVIIDFGESRTLYSPLPSKRREGDRYWLTKTMKELAFR